MRRYVKLAALLLLAACTQQPASVVDKNRSGGKPARQAAVKPTLAKEGVYVPPPVEGSRQVESADVGSIGVSDLPPPSGAKAVAKPAPKVETPRNEAFQQDVPKLEAPKPEAKGNTAVKAFPVDQGKNETATGNLAWPSSSHKVAGAYSKSTDGMTLATDSGEPVYAADAGEVVFSGNVRNLGSTVIVKHRGGRNTTYAHLQSAKVEKYDRVGQGDILGYTGKEPLYFAVREGKGSVDPKGLLK